MYKSLLFSLILFFFCSLTTIAQSSGQSGEGTDEPSFKKAHENHVSEDITVHTYQLQGVLDIKHHQDEAGEQDPPSEIQQAMDELEKKGTVRRSRFDHATSTLTVYSDRGADLPSRIDILSE